MRFDRGRASARPLSRLLIVSTTFMACVDFKTYATRGDLTEWGLCDLLLFRRRDYCAAYIYPSLWHRASPCLVEGREYE